MQDEETGTWWQQVTGKAILGPLKGQQLKIVPSEIVTFDNWKQERHMGRVLRPDNRDERWKEFADDFERERSQAKPPQTTDSGDELPRDELIAGISINGRDKAYRLKTLEQQSPIIDRVGDVPIMVVMSDDGKSVRAFETEVDGENLEFFAKPEVKPLHLVDQKTGSEWDFSGRCLSGPLTNKQLRKISLLVEYWFDWKNYHPQTVVYQLQVN